MSRCLSFKAAAVITMILMVIPAALSAEDESQQVNAVITEWLQLGPLTTPMPAFHEEGKGSFGSTDLLLFDEIDPTKLKPAKGRPLVWQEGREITWNPVRTSGIDLKIPTDQDDLSVAYLAVYIDVKRWTQGQLTIKTPQVYNLYLDGKLITQKKIFSRKENGEKKVNGQTVTTDLRMETGKHLLLIKTVHDPATKTEWKINAVLYFNAIFADPLTPHFTTSPESFMSITSLLEGPKVAGITISPDAAVAGVYLREVRHPGNGQRNWLKLYNVSDGKIIHTFGGSEFSGLTWSPDGRFFAYATYDNRLGTLWIVNRTTGETIPFLKNVQNLGNFTWAPDARFIIYSVSEEGPNDMEGVKRLKDMNDRLPGSRTRSSLYKASLPDGFCQRLTAGELTTSLNSISPDGSKLLFSRSVTDFSQRPYSITELYALDLNTLKADLLWKGPWINSAQWIPDGETLLILGGPSAFGEAGINLPRGMVPNDYDIQAYLLNPKTEKVDPITKDFDPSVLEAFIDQNSHSIYFTAEDRSYRHLYRYDVKGRNFLMVDTGIEVLDQFMMARSSPIAVYTGSSATSPSRAFLINLDTYNFRVFQDPSARDYADVAFGRVERWTFKNKKGTDIEGRIYYPPDFDETVKYPCIVYYYGGTSPVTRDFGGRYPKNLWAANGYVVYVLQPSGATGFGQEFSAMHVNDWGLTVADEIIEGVTKFISTHPFVNPEKVGCIGASYGGFMTMLLLTRTNIFTTAVAHAGISSISSYWGEGYWGYLYSAIAAANSFPWNRKDIFVDQSPLFNADKISTPLLMLHGDADTNVPPGESTQLFAALKLLGREVEYVQIEGQNHHILEYNKRRIWSKTIIAWFDKWLKSQPQWWFSLYPH